MSKFKVGDRVRLKKSVTREDLGKVHLDCRQGQRDLLDPRDAGHVFRVIGAQDNPDRPSQNTQLENGWWVDRKWLKLVEAESEQDPLHDPNDGDYVPIGHATLDEALHGPTHSDGGVWLAPAGTPLPTAADINGPDSPWTKLGEVIADGYEEFQDKINEASAKLAASMEGVTVENFQSGALITDWDLNDCAAALGIDSKGDPDVGPNEDSFYPGGKIYADASLGEVAKDEITFTVEQVVALLNAFAKEV